MKLPRYFLVLDATNKLVEVVSLAQFEGRTIQMRLSPSTWKHVLNERGRRAVNQLLIWHGVRA